MKKFQKHIRDIFEMLEQLIAKNDLYGFVTCLSNEIKNLCCRLGKTGAMDKKLERALKQDLLVKLKKECETCCEKRLTDEALYAAIEYQALLGGKWIGLSPK